jgi:PAS domain S-box-containing protein
METLLQKIWVFALRDQAVSLEVRLFRLVCLTFSPICLFLVLPANLILGLSPFLNLVITIFGLLSLFFYRDSLRGRHHIKVFCLALLLVLNVAWFMNGGSTGSIGYFFLCAVLCPMILFRGSTRWYMLLLLVIDNCALQLVEYRFPLLITPYQTAADRLIDTLCGYSSCALASALIFGVVTIIFDKESARAQKELQERSRAEATLAYNEAKYRALFEEAGDYIFILKMDKERGAIIVDANNAAFEKHGFTREELIGMPMMELDTPAARAKIAPRAKLLQNPGDKAVFETEHYRKDGTTFPVEASARVIQIGDDAPLVLTIERDITERRRMESELLKSQKLESIGVLAGGIAHDFNNILTAIMGNISFAQMYLDAGDPALKILQEAEKASQRAADLANQLMTFTKGNQPVKKIIAARQIIEASASLLLRGTSVQSTIRIEEPLHTIEVDEGQINQVFNNIIINAVQAMPDGGTMAIAAANSLVANDNPLGLAPGEYVRFTFSDTGSGIAKEDVERIFDPYFTTKELGNGLGLASAHSIICKHAGHIRVSSVLGQGSAFEILLPAGSATSVPQSAGNGASDAADLLAGEGEGMILVMDDDEMIRTLASEMLTVLGYQALSCVNGEEAVSRYRDALTAGIPFVAVIMDLTIPGGMGGKEAAQQILAMDANARLIVSSGYSDDPIMADPARFGFSEVIAKPYRMEEITGVLSRLRDRALD